MVIMLPDRRTALQPDWRVAVLAGSRRAAGEALPSLLAPSALLRRASSLVSPGSAAARRELGRLRRPGRERRRPGRIAPGGPAGGLRGWASASVALTGCELNRPSAARRRPGPPSSRG